MDHEVHIINSIPPCHNHRPKSFSLPNSVCYGFLTSQNQSILWFFCSRDVSTGSTRTSNHQKWWKTESLKSCIEDQVEQLKSSSSDSKQSHTLFLLKPSWWCPRLHVVQRSAQQSQDCTVRQYNPRAVSLNEDTPPFQSPHEAWMWQNHPQGIDKWLVEILVSQAFCHSTGW